MAAHDDWSVNEVRLAVQDYMRMLSLELSNQPYNKTAHRRALLEHLPRRSHGSIELKHQNISAILHEIGLFWIPGYKPRGNYQRLLADEVIEWIKRNPEFDHYALSAAEAPAVVPDHWDFTHFEEPKPEPRRKQEQVHESQSRYGSMMKAAGVQRDYIARESRNIALGTAGEELVLKYEQERLSRAGYDRLADKVEHVSRTQGDGLGFDILSFEPSGKERFIEVKTTAFAKETPFFATAREVTFARENFDQYNLYRVFTFKKSPKCFVLKGSIDQHCELDSYSFRCILK